MRFITEVENHAAAVALYFMCCNIEGVQTLRLAPGMEERLVDHVWSVEGIVHLLEAR